MKRCPRHLFPALLASFLLLSVPARSAVPEKDSQVTLTNLLAELKASYASALESDSLLTKDSPHRKHLAEMVKEADEVTIMLYTQRPEYSFDVAFALENVSRMQGSFREQAGLSNQYLSSARSGLRRYVLLEESLREMYLNHPVDSLLPRDSLLIETPFPATLEEKDSVKTVLLDSCLRYTGLLTGLYRESVMTTLQDSLYFADTERRLQQAREYAETTYADSQKNRFIGGNVNIIELIRHWNSYIQYVKGDLRSRYRSEPVTKTMGEGQGNPYSWSGSYVISYAVLSIILLVASLVLAILIMWLVFKFVKSERLRPFRPILEAILSILLFVASLYLVNLDRANPYWRMAYQLLNRFAWLTLAIFISLFIRVRGVQARPSLHLYQPTILLAFLSILMRAVFLPASLVPLILPLAILLFLVWQTCVNVRYRAQASLTDRRYMWVSVGVMAVVGILSLCGYSMIGVLILTFWTFQLALLHTITTLYFLMMRYYEDRVTRRKVRFHTENPNLPLDDKHAFIEVTWLYDLLRMVIVPIAAIYSFQASIMLTARAYQLTQAGQKLLSHPFLSREGMEELTISNILLVFALFFVFRYLIYLFRGLYRQSKLRRLLEKRGNEAGPLKESDVNLSLPNTMFSLLGWLLYLIIAFYILHIPTAAITAIMTGLSAGVGFALKDLINNFFYGIQLMAGRIRVGDKISCDGIRGIVKRVSYQTTQVEEEDGSVIAFTNTELFSKKFKNLNIGKNYELVKIPVSVRYGTDFEFARKVILEALKPLMVKDKAGRDIVDPDFPVDVRFDSFAESAVNIHVVLYTTVETHYTFPARAKEAIYKAFYENGIKIPFPQRDIHIKTSEEAE